MKTPRGFLIVGGLVAALFVGCVARPPVARTGAVLTEAQRELVGKKLHWQLVALPSGWEGIDHVHCPFCATQMVEANGAGGRKGETDGYTTDDRRLWVCNRCFDRLNPEFHWVEK